MGVTDAELSAAMDVDVSGATESAGQADEQQAEVQEEVAAPQETQAAEEPQVETEPEVQAIPAEPEDPAARSNLGRKVQAMSYELAQTRDQLQQALGRLNELQVPVRHESQDEDYDLPVSKAELPKLVEQFVTRREQENVQRQRAYETGVHKTLVDIGVEYKDMPDDEYTAIADIALKNFVYKTKDPAIDAEYNFNRAMGQYYRSRKAPQKQNPLSGNVATINAPLGGPSNTVVRSTSKQTFKLDKNAAALAAAFGWGDEKVSQVLSR